MIQWSNAWVCRAVRLQFVHILNSSRILHRKYHWQLQVPSENQGARNKLNLHWLCCFWIRPVEPPCLILYQYQMEKAMAPHSGTLAWKIPWTEEPGGLQSMGSLRVRHDWETSLSLFTSMHWRRKWQPTPVFLPGESQGWGSLVGCRLWGRTESDTTEAT